jgi:hypothetical protein
MRLEIWAGQGVEDLECQTESQWSSMGWWSQGMLPETDSMVVKSGREVVHRYSSPAMAH